MHLTSTFLLLVSALALAHGAQASDAVPNAAAIPAAEPPPADDPATADAAAVPHRPCIVPQIFFTSLPNDFILSALISGPSTSTGQASIPVRLDPPTPSKEKESVPIISRVRIASTRFQLVNQTLVASDFTAHKDPTIAIFPPPLSGFGFGGSNVTPAKYGAAYACDSTGRQILTLRPDNGKLPVSSLYP